MKRSIQLTVCYNVEVTHGERKQANREMTNHNETKLNKIENANKTDKPKSNINKLLNFVL